MSNLNNAMISSAAFANTHLHSVTKFYSKKPNSLHSVQCSSKHVSFFPNATHLSLFSSACRKSFTRFSYTLTDEYCTRLMIYFGHRKKHSTPEQVSLQITVAFSTWSREVFNNIFHFSTEYYVMSKVAFTLSFKNYLWQKLSPFIYKSIMYCQI